MTAFPTLLGIVQMQTASASCVRALASGCPQFCTANLHLRSGLAPYLLERPTAHQADTSLCVHLSLHTPTDADIRGCPLPRSARLPLPKQHQRGPFVVRALGSRPEVPHHRVQQFLWYSYVQALQHGKGHLRVLTISGLTSGTGMIGLVV